MEKAQSKNYVQYNAFYRWFLSLINFYSRTAEEKKCLYPTHERESVGPSFLASWLAFYLRLVQKDEKIKELEPLWGSLNY